ncbi:MAG: AAA family ATPase [Candidatus Sungbacteria bacterium]|nr:AAA family ATPase [Candidatus Sungbacteria bacterium]
MAILGHERQVAYLERARENGKLAHAYLLYGPERVGKLAVAQEFAKRLGAEIVLIDREHTLVSKKDERRDIPIEDIRELKRMWTLTPGNGAWRVLIINDAEHMSDQAANAFLKLLEEPGAQTVIFLIASSRDLLMPTIISRAVNISFSLVPDAVLREYLLGVHEKVDLLLALAGGRPGVLLELLCEPDVLAKEEALLRDLAYCLAPGRAPEVFQLSAQIAGDREAFGRLISHLYGLMRKGLLGHVADGAYSTYIGSIKHLDRMAYMIETSNAQTRLGLDALLLAMQRK